MTDRKALDANEPPEDVASLYSWANLHGAKYRDFSAARAQTREKARQRVQQVIDEERERARQQIESQQIEAQKRSTGAAPVEEQAHLAELATQLAAQLAAHQASHPPAQQQIPDRRPQFPQQAAQRGPERIPPAPQGFGDLPPLPKSAWRQTLSEGVPLQPPPQQPQFGGMPERRSTPPLSALRENAAPQPPVEPRGAYEQREMPARPAWLAEAPESLLPPIAPQAPDDTVQGSREKLTSRWFALKTLFDTTTPPTAHETVPGQSTSRTPVLGVFSLAGGVGKTSLVATLGRALSARGERVLLVDTAAFGLLPFFFGARDQRLGQLRTFTPPANSGDSPIQMITLDPDAMESSAADALANEIGVHARGVSRIIIDLATASGATARRVLKLAPLVLVPVIPDMNSVVSVGSIDAFFEHAAGAGGKTPHYILNQFDSSLPLHLDVREVLREQLGDRLLPFALRRSPTVSEALAEGMTVIDYAPSSTIAEDFGSLASWLKSLSAPASTGFRGVRWSER